MRRIAIAVAVALLFTTCKQEESSPPAEKSAQPSIREGQSRPAAPTTKKSPIPPTESARRVPATVQDGTVIVVFEANPERSFYVDGKLYGTVNIPTQIPAGTYRIDLGEPRNYSPSNAHVSVDERGSTTVTFRPNE